MSAITLLIHLVWGILGGLKVGRENNFFWCLVWVIWGRKIDGVRMFFFLSSSKRNLFKIGKNNRRKSVAKMLKKKKAHDTSSMMIYCATFFFLGLVVSLFFSFSQSGRKPQMHCVYFFWFFKKLGTIVFYFLFVNLPFLF